MMLQADKHWPDFCRHIDRPDLIDDARFASGNLRFANRAACIAILDELFAQRTLAEWGQKFATMEGPWAPMQTAEELHHDPQSVANGYLPEVDGGDKGRFKLVASPVQFDETPLEIRGPSPEMGQHTEEVLLELGVEWDDLVRYKEAGAIL